MKKGCNLNMSRTQHKEGFMLKGTLQGAALLAMLGTAVPAFAEVQNVRVGGDITTRAFLRDNLDLHDNDGTLDGDNFFQSTIGINVGADMTENVSAFIRLANERDWNIDAGSTADFALSQGYVTLKELFYSPLTLRIGRQPIVWGRGFVLGSSLITDHLGRGGADLHGAITADEFTDFTSFDAVRATLDLSGAAAVDLPFMLDYVYIKVDENATGVVANDVNLQGVNLSTQFENGEMELYYLNKRDKNTAAVATTTGGTAGRDGNINTLGLRGSLQPNENSNIWAEAAYQFGRRNTDPNAILPAGNSHQAWAFNLGAEIGLDVAMAPKVGAEWIYFSGQDLDGAVSGWDPIARGYFTTALREFQATGFYPADQTCQSAGAIGRVCTGSVTNQHQFSLMGSFVPMEDLTVNNRMSWFFQDIGSRPDRGGGPLSGSQVNQERKNYIGAEWDTQVSYDYTDDVEFGLIYGLFLPGSVFRNPTDNTAQELITSVSVKF
jgi:hypothetical protein